MELIVYYKRNRMIKTTPISVTEIGALRGRSLKMVGIFPKRKLMKENGGGGRLKYMIEGNVSLKFFKLHIMEYI